MIHVTYFGTVYGKNDFLAGNNIQFSLVMGQFLSNLLIFNAWWRFVWGEYSQRFIFGFKSLNVFQNSAPDSKFFSTSYVLK